MSFLLPFMTLLLLPLVHADSNGMDMSMDGAMSLSTPSTMLNYLHFHAGDDNLWFVGWTPKSAGTLAGACVGLFLLGVLERWVAGGRAVGERVWGRSAQIAQSNRLNSPQNQSECADCAPSSSLPSPSGSKSPRPRVSLTGPNPPFVPAHDVARAVMHVAQSLIGFGFMLCVMTYQASFIISIVLGLGVGETLFGRYARRGAHLA